METDSKQNKRMNLSRFNVHLCSSLASFSLLIQRPQKMKDEEKKDDGENIEKQGEMDDGWMIDAGMDGWMQRWIMDGCRDG